jgi:CDP-diacylglycerol pyrophosphatase
MIRAFADMASLTVTSHPQRDAAAGRNHFAAAWHARALIMISAPSLVTR